MTKINLTSSLRHHKTRGAISVEVQADPLEVEADPDLNPIATALAAAVRELVGSITAKGADGHQLFNRTGHFRNSLVAVGKGAEWVIRAAADRLQGERGAIMLERLYELVPELRDPGRLFQRAAVKAAVSRVLATMVMVRKR